MINTPIAKDKKGFLFSILVLILATYLLLPGFGLIVTILHLHQMPSLGGFFVANVTEYALTGVLMLISIALFATGHTLANLCFAVSLVSTSLIQFETFKTWLLRSNQWTLGEWLLIEAILVQLFLHWSKVACLPLRKAKQNALTESDIDSKRGFLNRSSWCSGSAFLCVVCMVYLLQLISCAYVFLLLKHFIPRSLSLLVCTYGLTCITALACTSYYADVRSLRNFVNWFDFRRPNPLAVTVSAVCGIVISEAALYFVRRGQITAHNPTIDEFHLYGTTGVSYANCALLLIPFVEEVVMRGFLYRAFRRDYSVLVAVSYIAAIVLLGHFTAISGSLDVAVALMMLNVVLCLIREKTNSIWNCILCHIAYNGMCILSR